MVKCSSCDRKMTQAVDKCYECGAPLLVAEPNAKITKTMLYFGLVGFLFMGLIAAAFLENSVLTSSVAGLAGLGVAGLGLVVTEVWLLLKRFKLGDKRQYIPLQTYLDMSPKERLLGRNA